MQNRFWVTIYEFESNKMSGLLQVTMLKLNVGMLKLVRKSCDSISACTWENWVDSKGGLAIVDVEHVLYPVLGSALAGVSPAQQTEGFDVGGGSLDVTACVIHGCRETSNKWLSYWLPTRLYTTVSYSTLIWLAE